MRPLRAAAPSEDDGRQRRTTGVSAGRRASGPDDGRQCLGLVSLVGAGPGDPDLLTCRAARRLTEADLVLHDGLVTDDVLALAVTAERICVSRRPGAKVVDQAGVTHLMIEAARAGRRVVRLKAGDPFVLGRGGEEALALAEARVPFEVVPGLTSAVAAPAVAGIPVTHRGVASGFVVVSGHAPEAYTPILESLPAQSLTVIVLMGFAERGRVARVMMARGWAADTPAAIVANATQARERIWTGPLNAVGEALSDALAGDTHALIIGEVVSVGAVIARAIGQTKGDQRSERAVASESARTERGHWGPRE